MFDCGCKYPGNFKNCKRRRYRDPKPPPHYAFTTTVYPDIPGHWGDVNHLDQKKQKCSPENLVGINHSQITFFYSENPTKNRPKGTHLSSTFSKTANLLTERRSVILQTVL